MKGVGEEFSWGDISNTGGLFWRGGSVRGVYPSVSAVKRIGDDQMRALSRPHVQLTLPAKRKVLTVAGFWCLLMFGGGCCAVCSPQLRFQKSKIEKAQPGLDVMCKHSFSKLMQIAERASSRDSSWASERTGGRCFGDRHSHSDPIGVLSRDRMKQTANGYGCPCFVSSAGAAKVAQSWWCGCQDGGK